MELEGPVASCPGPRPRASSSAGVYALMASGLTLIFGVMRIINIAQGAFLILVATVTWWLWRETGIDPILISVITTPLMFGLGWLLYR